MTGREWLQYFMDADAQNKKRKADWLDMAGTGLGAGAGFLLGGPAGAAAGARLGGTLGGVGEAAANHDLTPQGVVGAAAQGVGGYGDLMGAARNQAAMRLLQQLTGAGFPQGFAYGGIAGMPDPRALLAMIQGAPDMTDPTGGPTAEDLAGPAPPVPQYAQAKHPGWEAAAAVLGDVLGKLPAPRQTNSSNKTIGAYMPALGAGLSGIAARAASRREAENKPLREQYIADQAAHRTRLTNAGRELAIWRRMKALQGGGTAGGGSATKLDVPLTQDEATAIGRPELVGVTPRQAGLMKKTNNALEVTPLTGKALDQAAWEFATTGRMPTYGRGPTGDNQRNLTRNRAAELFPGLNVGESQATFGSNRASLTSLQKMYDAVVSFENTAIANSKNVEAALKKVPSILGPALNTPLRDLATKFGSESASELRAAVATIQPEFARILSNPTLAGQLTDTARREMQDVIDGGATLGQMRRVVKLLTSDAHNRRSALERQIATARARIRATGDATDAPKWEDF